jgi:hypothetical protein
MFTDFLDFILNYLSDSIVQQTNAQVWNLRNRVAQTIELYINRKKSTHWTHLMDNNSALVVNSYRIAKM